MMKLTIRNFSCIEEADIEISNLTVLIGAQASGKSLIAKLAYFFQDVISAENVSSFQDVDEVRGYISYEFERWFPAEAWGNKDFQIIFSAEQIMISIENSRLLGIDINFSEAFESAFLQFRLYLINELAPHINTNDFYNYIDEYSAKNTAYKKKVYKKYTHSLSSVLNNSPFFIPAGRSFFTTLGKTFSVAKESHNLEPLIEPFGNLLTFFREHPSNLPTNALWNSLFGGEFILQKKQSEYFLSTDGRKIPMGFLSSGQQELFPLWLMTPLIESGHHNLFIEEPEAHLFPEAQAQLTQYIASCAVNSTTPRSILITTHSPYILATVNNLLQAGEMAEKLDEKTLKKVAKLIPKAAWLRRGTTTAYALADGKATNLIDDDGLIDGEYLDAVSGKIAENFSALLEIEYGNKRL
jgi:hypothetical protein